jgi:formamidopyrimidine-DNA glycosylase
MRTVLDKSCRENQNTVIVFSDLFFYRKCAFHEIMWGKYRIGQATNKNMAHAHCVMDTQGYKHTIRLCNTYCFSTATTFARTRLNVSLSALRKLGIAKTQRTILFNFLYRTMCTSRMERK